MSDRILWCISHPFQNLPCQQANLKSCSPGPCINLTRVRRVSSLSCMAVPPGLQICAPCLQADVLAGTSVAALVVPQGMSYAALAGLPSVYGLYGAFVPVLCYAALGSSRHLVSVIPSQCG